MPNQRPDYKLLIAIVLLLLAGLLILVSVSAVFSQENFGRTTYYLFHQLLWGLAPGIILGFIAYKINLDLLKKLSWFLFLASLILMGLVLVPGMGITSGGASRWLDFSFFSFQPSEPLKLSFILYLSYWLAKRTEKTKSKKINWNGTFPVFLFLVGIITLLLALQSNLSTLIVILASAGLIYFAAEAPLLHMPLMFLGGLGLVYLLIKIVPYRMGRIAVMLDPLKDPMGLGYHLKQTLIAVGSGGIFGLGLGMSNQKFGFVPETMSDSIFAIFAEESGLVGSFSLIIIFLFFMWRGLKIAKMGQDKFSRLFAVGIVSWICIQAMVNIGAMIGVVPPTGIPLPFISYGGTHIVMELIGVGILLNISKSVRKGYN